MAIFCDSYDYWNLDEDWFVAGYTGGGRTAVQFRPTRTMLIHGIANRYRDGDVLDTMQLMSGEDSWHQKQRECA